MYPHITVEHGRLVEHPHLTRCRMVSGAADTAVVKCGWIQRCVSYACMPSILYRVHYFKLPHLVMVNSHISFNSGSVTGSNECSCLIYQLVFICSLLTEFDEVMSAHQYLQGCGAFTMPNRYDTVSNPARACTAGRYVVMCLCFIAVWRISMLVLQHMGSPF